LTFQVADGALEGIEQPLLTWRIVDAATGRAVYPGGAGQDDELTETGATMLLGENAEGCSVDTLAEGVYTVRWELHSIPTEDARGAGDTVALSGEAQVQVSAGQETVVDVKR